MATVIFISVLVGAVALRIWAEYSVTQTLRAHPELNVFLKRHMLG